MNLDREERRNDVRSIAVSRFSDELKPVLEIFSFVQRVKCNRRMEYHHKEARVATEVAILS